MKRRNLLKTLVLTLSFPLTAFGKSRAKVKNCEIHVVGLGTVGSRWVADQLQGFDIATVTVISDRQPDRLPKIARFIPFHAPEEAYDYFEENRFLKKKLQLNQDLDPAMLDFLDGKKGLILLVAGLGKYSGSVLVRSLVQKLHQRNDGDSLKCLVTVPFAFEGSQAGKIGQEVSDFLLSKNLGSPILLEEVRARHGNLAVRSAFKKGDDLIMERFLELMASEKGG